MVSLVSQPDVRKLCSLNNEALLTWKIAVLGGYKLVKCALARILG